MSDERGWISPIPTPPDTEAHPGLPLPKAPEGPDEWAPGYDALMYTPPCPTCGSTEHVHVAAQFGTSIDLAVCDAPTHEPLSWSPSGVVRR